MVSLPWSVELCRNGWTGSRRGGRTSMKMHAQGALKHHVSMKTFVLTIWWRQTVELPLEWLQKKLGISNGSVQTFLKENLNMRKLCAKIVPNFWLTSKNKERVDCCNDWIESAQDPYFRERVITGEEAWIYEYDRETKRQSEEWKHPGSPHNKKVVQKSRPCSSFFSIFVKLFIINLF